MRFSLDTLASPGGEAPSLMSSEFLMLRELLAPKHLVVYLSSVVHHVGRRNCAQKWQKGKTFLEINVRRVLSNVFLQFPRFNMGFLCFSMFFGGISASALKNCIGNNFWIRLVKIMTEALAISAWRHHDSIWPSTGCPVRVDQTRKAVSDGSLWSQDVSSASISQVQSIMKSVNNLNSSFRSRTLPAPVSILLITRQEMLKNIFTTQIGRHNRGTSDRSSRSSFVPSEAKESRERRHSIASSMHAPPSPTRRERRNSVALSHWSALIWFRFGKGHQGSLTSANWS